MNACAVGKGDSVASAPARVGSDGADHARDKRHERGRARGDGGEARRGDGGEARGRRSAGSDSTCAVFRARHITHVTCCDMPDASRGLGSMKRDHATRRITDAPCRCMATWPAWGPNRITDSLSCATESCGRA